MKKRMGRMCVFISSITVVTYLRAQEYISHPDVKPAEIVVVESDELKLPATTPNSWMGDPLPSLLTGNPESGVPRITEEGALDPKSLVVQFRGKTLVEGKDYLVDGKWGFMRIGSQPVVSTTDQVTASYRYSLLRLDSIVRGPNGKEYVKEGKSEVTTPHPPNLALGETRIANIYVPYYSDGKSASTVLFPIFETPDQAVTATTRGRIPRTMAKIRAAEPVKIVAWGDSITAGGDASLPKYRYPAILEQQLRARFRNTEISVAAVAAGSSTSRMWLYPDRFSYPSPLSWDKVVASHPDLITIEFVNDANIDAPETLPDIYNDILKRAKSLGTEVILITPSYLNLSYMHFDSYEQQDGRSYVRFLRQFAEDHQLAVADVSSRWGHLWKEGLPYTTLLVNSINHPDDRGHEMFVEELMKCFE